jgi:hypothetical protein
LSEFPQIPEGSVHRRVVAQGWIPNALLDVVKNGASGSGDSLPQFASIHLAHRCVV